MWRRWLGIVFLAISFGMLVWGQTVLKSQLTGLGYLLYWTVCICFTLFAIATALVDILLVRRKHRKERKHLIQETFTDLNKLNSADHEAGPDCAKYSPSSH